MRDFSGSRIQLLGAGFDHNGLRKLANLQSEIRSEPSVRGQVQSGLATAFKSGLVYLDLVWPDRQFRYGIKTLVVSRDDAPGLRVGVCDRYLGTCDRGSPLDR